MFYRNHLLNLKSDVLKINTNVKQLFHEIFIKNYIISLYKKNDFERKLSVSL